MIHRGARRNAVNDRKKNARRTSVVRAWSVGLQTNYQQLAIQLSLAHHNLAQVYICAKLGGQPAVCMAWPLRATRICVTFTLDPLAVVNRSEWTMIPDAAKLVILGHNIAKRLPQWVVIFQLVMTHILWCYLPLFTFEPCPNKKLYVTRLCKSCPADCWARTADKQRSRITYVFASSICR